MRARVSCSSAGLFLLLAHLPFLSTPYFWDEAGQFIPASLDIFRAGAIVPVSTIPNVHPPGVMLWLAGIWSLFGYSIPATRLAMLAIAIVACASVYQLAAGFLCRDSKAAVFTLTLLCLSPLFFSQSEMALLDMPAMAFTALALLLFLRDRIAASALACLALTMVKETGALLPAVLGIVLMAERRKRESLWMLLPALPLIAWLSLLHARTGHWFGNASFAQYNLFYPVHPVRLVLALFRRGYYLFIGTFYWIGTAALLRSGIVRSGIIRSRAWRVAGIFAAAHILAVCVLGGAVLERYLLPVLPLVLAAFANALSALTARWRAIAFAGMCAGSVACIFVNPVYPFPLENNLAWTDFVDVQLDAARYLSANLPEGAVISSSFPFAGCLRKPEFGYTSRTFLIDEVPDFTRESLEPLRNHRIDALALFSAEWDGLHFMSNPRWIAFLTRFYAYRPEMQASHIPGMLGYHRVARFERRGQWIEIYRP